MSITLSSLSHDDKKCKTYVKPSLELRGKITKVEKMCGYCEITVCKAKIKFSESFPEIYEWIKVGNIVDVSIEDNGIVVRLFEKNQRKKY